jgi:hypothetical protein
MIVPRARERGGLEEMDRHCQMVIIRIVLLLGGWLHTNISQITFLQLVNVGTNGHTSLLSLCEFSLCTPL